MSVGLLIEENPLCLRAARVEEGQATALRHLFPARTMPMIGELYRTKVMELDKRLGAAYLELGARRGFLRRQGALPDKGRTVLAEVRREPIGDKGADLTDRAILRLPMATVLLCDGAVKAGPLGEGNVDEALLSQISDEGAPGLVDPRPLSLRLLMSLLDAQVTEIAVTRAETKNTLLPFLPDDLPVHVMEPAEAAVILDEAEEEGLACEHALPSGGRLIVEETEALFAVDLDLGNQGGQSKKGAGTKLLGEALATLGRLGSVMGLGGQIILDVPRGAIAAPKIVRDQITRALKPLGRVSVPAVTPEGICVVIAPRPRPSLRDELTETGADPIPGRRFRTDHLAATALRNAERVLEEKRTGEVTLFVTKRVIPLLEQNSRAMHDIVQRFGPRLVVKEQTNAEEREPFHVQA